MINSIGIALTGLNAAAMRLNASASNIANMNTDSSAYTPITTQSKSIEMGGVSTSYIPQNAPFTPSYDPNSPFTNNSNGFTEVDISREIVNMKMAEISYKASLNIIKAADKMFDELIK